MKKILTTITIFAIACGVGCRDYLDINDDPQSPSGADILPGSVFPAAEMALTTSYGNFLRITGGYHVQHYAHLNGTSNYLDYSRFSMSPVRSSTFYLQMNQIGLKNLRTVLEKSRAVSEWGTHLAATTLRAFIFQALVDCYGEVPYSEAIDDNISEPKYDDGRVIYEGILAELDAAMARDVGASSPVATNFLYPSSTIPTAQNWIRFANALRLKLLTRMSDVPGAAVAGRIEALLADDNFPTTDVAYTSCWANEPGQFSPFFAEEFSSAWGSTQTNVAANVAIIGSMLIKDSEGGEVYRDPRLARFFNSTANNPGSVSGTQYSSTTLASWCRPNIVYNSPVYLISVAEVEFFKAEYHARRGSHDTAARHYAAAIAASFASAGVSGAEANAARYPYDPQNWRHSIGVAKWVALAGTNSFEAWCEARRLRFPAFGSKTGDDFYQEGVQGSFDPSSYEPGTLYTPIQVFGQVGPGKLLERYPYAESSSSRNSKTPTFPGYTTPVFWANN